MQDFFDLTGKVAVVTGGVGGIGQAVAMGMAKSGADIAIVDFRDLTTMEPVLAEIRKLGRKAMAVSIDITKPEQVADMTAKVLKEFKHIDILFNAAGMTIRKTGLQLNVDEFRKVLEVNTTGTFLCCQAIGKVMVEQKSGKVINMSSIRGIMGTPAGAAAYGTSKGAVDALTRTLAAEWARSNVFVNALAPSIVVTELTKALTADPVRLKSMTDKVPLGKLADVDHVVGPAIFLASRASDYMTGQILYIDGGLSSAVM